MYACRMFYFCAFFLSAGLCCLEAFFIGSRCRRVDLLCVSLTALPVPALPIDVSTVGIFSRTSRACPFLPHCCFYRNFVINARTKKKCRKPRGGAMHACNTRGRCTAAVCHTFLRYPQVRRLTRVVRMLKLISSNQTHCPTYAFTLDETQLCTGRNLALKRREQYFGHGETIVRNPHTDSVWWPSELPWPLPGFSIYPLGVILG